MKRFLAFLLATVATWANAQALISLPTPILSAAQTTALNGMITARGKDGTVVDVLTLNRSAIDNPTLTIRLEGQRVTFTGVKTFQPWLPTIASWRGVTTSGTAGTAMLTSSSGGTFVGTVYYGDKTYEIVQIGEAFSTAAAIVLVKYIDGYPE